MLKLSLVSVGVVSLVLLGGCAKAPEVEIAGAKTAIEAAEKSQAEVYAQAELLAAKDSLHAALLEIEKQNSALAPMRTYERAKALLAGAQQAAAAAAQKSAAEKERLTAEATAQLEQLKVSIAAAKDLLASASAGKTGKSGKETLDAISGNIVAMEAAAGELAVVVQAGDLVTARDKVKAAQETVNSVTEQLNAFVAKAAPKK